MTCIIASLAKQFSHLTVLGEEREQYLSEIPAEWIVTTSDPEAAKVKCPEKYGNVTMDDSSVILPSLSHGTLEPVVGGGCGMWQL